MRGGSGDTRPGTSTSAVGGHPAAPLPKILPASAYGGIYAGGKLGEAGNSVHKNKDSSATKNKLQKVISNARRRPNWPPAMLHQCNRVALQFEKRMILWDDGDEGFYLWLNWDWLRNRPREMPAEKRNESGWYANLKPQLKLPLLDTSLPDDQLAAWIDGHTMACHALILDKLMLLRRETTGKLLLYDQYQKEMDKARLPYQ